MESVLAEVQARRPIVDPFGRMIDLLRTLETGLKELVQEERGERQGLVPPA